MDLQWDAVVEVGWLGLGMALVATLLWMAYRTMDHPRLPVIRDRDDGPRANWPGAARYVLMTPILVVFWLSVLLVLITAVAKDRSAEQVTAAASAVIAGARLLAHFKHEIANELAKTVPIVILGVVIIGGQLAGWDAFERTFEQIPADVVDAYFVGLVLWDFLVTGIWFLVQRRRWRRKDLPPGRVTQWVNRWRRIGYAD